MTTGPPAALFRGLFESHLHVANLERAMNFYGTVLGLELGLKETKRRAALYWVGPNRNTMLGIWEQPPWFTSRVTKAVQPQHLAFEVGFDDLRAAIHRIKQHGVEVRNFFDDVTDEPSVFTWMPAASIYFNDVDGHLLEFIAKLDGVPGNKGDIIPLTKWMDSNSKDR